MDKLMLIRNMNLLTFMVLGYSLFIVNGCSIIGLGIGSHIDHKAQIGEKAKEIPYWDIEKVKPQSRVIVKLRSGDSIAGQYLGTEKYQETLYNQHLSDFNQLEKPNPPLPQTGVTVHLTLTYLDMNIVGNFMGFDLNNKRQVIVLSFENKSDYNNYSNLGWRFVSSVNKEKKEIGFNLNKIKTIAFQQDQVVIEDINAYMSYLRVPCRSCICIENESEIVYIPLNTIATVQGSSTNTNSATKAGFLIGFTIDAVIVTAAAIAGNQYRHSLH